ncbi:MAG: thermonuclease family protein [Rhodospirillaceae bacterium]|jgi:micrococcal nuclease|nr:thermonuclease family protein [Rhodospirillaceae bacterium]MBT5373771.1 thermonuclease family protein [Rhodospirillaceae bacterium]MBT5659328.1 thermonuclease family protein [Rhodospirillaceae bacterium]MBT5751992.1 thermonuclease family protein [Rhodospirillaceae bacterium]
MGLHFLLFLGVFLTPFALPAPGLAADSTTTQNADRGRVAEIVTETVAEIVDGDTIILADGRSVRLVGIQAPKLSLGRRNFKDWPLSDEAKAALEEMTGGEKVVLTFTGAEIDRHGRVLAHLHMEDGRWVQGHMLRAGLARVYSFADNRGWITEMLALEREARLERRGIWAHPFYRILGAGEAGEHIGTFQIIEGRVIKTAKAGGRTYINFGADWRNDFTVTLAPGTSRLFKTAGIDPLALDGRRVRVRGWLKSRNGPMIEITHPEQIELLEQE